MTDPFEISPTTDASVPDLDRSYALCRDLTKTHSKTFYFASLFLGPQRRRAIWAVYAFCRVADEIVDTEMPVALRLAKLDAWRAELRAAFAGKPHSPLMVAFADAVARYGIPIDPALDLLRGAQRDVTIRRYQTYEELREYCYLVASTVGLLTCPVLGYEEGVLERGALEYGAELGRAMQMTNILRDVGEDLRMGRIYLPAEDLARFDYPESALLAHTIDDRFVALMQFQIARVRALYDAAAPGIALLSASSQYTVRLALSLYRGILDEIERNGYDVFTRRAHVPLGAKLLTALSIVFAR